MTISSNQNADATTGGFYGPSVADFWQLQLGAGPAGTGWWFEALLLPEQTSGDDVRAGHLRDACGRFANRGPPE